MKNSDSQSTGRGSPLASRVPLVICTLAAAILLSGCASLVLKKGFPQYAGEIKGLSLHGQVEVFRDAEGIPHIYAGDAHDLMVAQGFVHAQDRLWQMELNRRLAQGRLSQIGGEKALTVDYLAHLIGLPEIRKRAVQTLSPRELDLLQAYMDGINAFLRLQGKDLPLEFRSAGLSPEPWSLEDLASTVALNAWFLQTNYRQELLAIKAASKLEQSAWDDLFPSHPLANLPEDGYFEAICSLKIAPLLPAALLLFKGLPTSPAATASNNWAVAQGPNGKPMLANDPHLALTVPGIWYWCHLHAPGLHIAGASLAGSPGISIGHNDSIAWGLTNVMTDCVDLFVLRVDPDHPTRYQVGDDTREMEQEEILIPLPRGKSKRIVLFRTLYGPVITEVKEGVEAVVALKWYGTIGEEELQDRSLQAVLSLCQAQGVSEALEAGRHMAFIGQNLVVADREGHIGWHATGAVPLRQGYSGRLPADGSSGKMNWIGFLPYEALPSRVDPSEGWIATANQRTVTDQDPHPISFAWAAPYRYDRIAHFLQGWPNPSPEDFRSLQMDVHSVQADQILPRILTLPYENDGARRAVRILERWDRAVEPQSQGAALFEVFLTEWVRALLEDELGEDLLLYLNAPGYYLVQDVILDRPNSPLWDRIDTPEQEGPREILEMALVRSMEWMERQLGPNPDRWSWGRLHEILFRHPGAKGGWSGRLLNRGPYPAPGDIHTINVGGFIPVRGNPEKDHPVKEYGVVWIPSLRMIVPLGDLDRTQIISPMGQSGQPGHPHYDDMIQPWLKGEMVTLPFSREKVKEAATQRLFLKP